MKIHLVKPDKLFTSECGVGTKRTLFSNMIEEVTCKRCEKSERYRELNKITKVEYGLFNDIQKLEW